MVAGDVILGLPSSGVHSNGHSLVRRIVEESGVNWLAPAPFTSNKDRLCDEILTPTQLYIKSLLPTLKKPNHGVKGLAHITGGGLVENIPRILPAHLSASLDASKWPIQPVFKWLQGSNRSGNKVAAEEMVRVFNCGIGMALIVSADQAETIIAEIKQSSSQEVYVIGSLVSGIHDCKVSNLEVHFST
jgi:phosphoribosylamine--glycine ligase/phosphoribosylformylglycinamidine cyclo-ligase